MMRSIAGLITAAAFGGIALLSIALPTAASAQVGREQDIRDLRLGQRVQVDDGSCPAGQIKEITGAQLTASGVTRVSKCVPRLGNRGR